MSNKAIACPNCGESIDVDSLLIHQTEERLKKEMQAQLSTKYDEIQKKTAALAEQERQMAEYKAKEKQLFAEHLEKEVKKNMELKSQEIQSKIEKELSEKSENQIKFLNETIEKEKIKNKELSTAQLDLMKLQQKLSEREEQFAIEKEKALLTAKEDIERNTKNKEREKFELREKEFLKQLEDQKKLVEEMKRKQEQGSMQLQGEVQELAIEEFLTQTFVFDEIIEIKKGARGGDCIHVVKNNFGGICGKVYYESKRTKDFQPTWINKFKDDLRQHQGDIGVIVTQSMPKDMDRFGLKDGVWICTFDDFKGLCHALRESILRVAEVQQGQENKGDKMSLLYDYFTSQTFKDTFIGMMEVYDTMRTDLDKEKNAMARIWKMRESQIDRFLTNANNLYGSIKGIAGNSIDLPNPADTLGLPEE
jgi:hypothetical protein